MLMGEILANCHIAGGRSNSRRTGETCNENNKVPKYHKQLLAYFCSLPFSSTLYRIWDSPVFVFTSTQYSTSFPFR
jgi:hypothetical protein